MGSCVFTLVSIELFNYFAGNPEVSFSPVRIVQAVAVGIGFIGGGVIFKRSSDIEGLTTAAGLWVAAAVGIAVGIKLYSLAIIVGLMVVIVLVVFGALERKLSSLKNYYKDEHRQKWLSRTYKDSLKDSPVLPFYFLFRQRNDFKIKGLVI